MRFVSTLPLFALTWLSGCSFDFTGLGEGGAASSSSSSSAQSAATSPTTSGPTTSSTTSSTPSSSGSTNPTTNGSTSSTGGAGGAPGDLPPCSGVIDAFDTIDGSVWRSSPSVTNNGNKVTVHADAGSIVGLQLLQGGTYLECYTSIKVVSAAGDDTSAIAIGIGDNGSNSAEAAYLGKTGNTSKVFQYPTNVGSPINVPDAPSHLGIAFHAGTVTYLYGDGGGWHVIAPLPRDAWMNDGQLEYLFFGLVTPTGATAVFDDFNGRAISIADLN